MTSLLLIGAGFSFHWGAPLADEVFGRLINRVHNDARLRTLLHDCNNTGGFESALSQLQTECLRTRDPESERSLTLLQASVSHVFDNINRQLSRIVHFEPQTNNTAIGHTVRQFLTDFNAIFSLNQDLLLERFHVRQDFPRRAGGLNTCVMPGMQQTIFGDNNQNAAETPWRPSEPFRVDANTQPFFKLHGSSNWIDDSSGLPLMVIGGQKLDMIDQHPILKWNLAQFRQHLRDHKRLMAFGYSFCDSHINKAIADTGSGLELFIVNPRGVSVLDACAEPERSILRDAVIYESRRTIADIFANNFADFDIISGFAAS